MNPEVSRMEFWTALNEANGRSLSYGIVSDLYRDFIDRGCRREHLADYINELDIDLIGADLDMVI